LLSYFFLHFLDLVVLLLHLPFYSFNFYLRFHNLLRFMSLLVPSPFGKIAKYLVHLGNQKFLFDFNLYLILDLLLVFLFNFQKFIISVHFCHKVSYLEFIIFTFFVRIKLFFYFFFLLYVLLHLFFSTARSWRNVSKHSIYLLAWILAGSFRKFKLCILRFWIVLLGAVVGWLTVQRKTRLSPDRFQGFKWVRLIHFLIIYQFF